MSTEKPLLNGSQKFRLFKKHIPYISYLVFSVSIITYFIPAYFSYLYPEEFNIKPWFFLRISTVIFLLFLSVSVAVYFAFQALALKLFARIFASFCMIWVFVAGFVFPIVHSAGMVSPNSLPYNFTNLLIAFLVSGALCYLLLTSKHKIWLLAATISAAGPILLYFSSELQSIPPDQNIGQVRNLSEISGQNNIIVLSFDGIPGNIVSEIIENSEEVAQELKDFTFFNNALANSPATEGSKFSELHGNVNIRKIGATISQAKEKMQHTGLFFDGSVDDVKTYGFYYNKFNPVKSNRIEINKASLGDRSPSEVLFFVNIALARVGSRASVIIFQRILKRFVARFNVYSFYHGTAWKEPYLKDKYVFEKIKENLSVSTSNYSVRYMHFMHTHFPVDFDKHGNMRSTSKEWHDNNQNYLGLYNQTVFALKQATDFINKLKKLSVYDNSLLVIKSDHGEPAYYFDTPPHNLSINNHSSWGYNRYRPMLLIKGVGIKQQKINIDERIVSLGDLAKTLCTARQYSNFNCNVFPGVDLLDHTSTRADNQPIFLEIVKDRNSSHRFETHKTIKLYQNENLLDILLLNHMITE